MYAFAHGIIGGIFTHCVWITIKSYSTADSHFLGAFSPYETREHDLGILVEASTRLHPAIVMHERPTRCIPNPACLLAFPSFVRTPKLYCPALKETSYIIHIYSHTRSHLLTRSLSQAFCIHPECKKNSKSFELFDESIYYPPY